MVEVRSFTEILMFAETDPRSLLNGLEIDPNILFSKEEIRKKIRTKRRYWFHPELVDIFLKLSESEAFWLSLVKVQNAGQSYSYIAHNSIQEIEFEDLKSIVLIFSHIIDAKSTYTVNHSDGVADLSRFLGELFKLSAHTCDKLELAGLLHDLGMLRIPDKILDKRGELTESENFIVRRHSDDTFEILKNIKGFEDISKWADGPAVAACDDARGKPAFLNGRQRAGGVVLERRRDLFRSGRQRDPAL